MEHVALGLTDKLAQLLCKYRLPCLTEPTQASIPLPISVFLSFRKRVFILGPSHHVRLSRCALSAAQYCRTPLYDLKVDQEVNAELEATGHFKWMDQKTDEDEHSIEMHLPYVAKVMEE